MAKSLLEQLPSVVAAGNRQASQILEHMEGQNRVSLQTRDRKKKNARASELLDYDRLRRSSTARQEKRL
jgi:hypothetical protein